MPVTVRMYNVGFGDCFLVTLEATDRNYRILFDCGRLAGSVPNTADELRFEAVIARLVDDLREKDEHGVERRRIDLLIVTHRHRDHVHGFSKTELWNDVEVGEVWMPWVEDPSNRHARALVEKQEQLARRTFRALKALRAAAGNGSNHALDSAAEIAYNATSNATAMKLLHEGLKTDHKNRFLPRLGYFPESLTTAELSGRIPEGVTMHVLGPSRDPDVMTSLDPPDGSAYEPFERKTATEHHDEADDDADAAEVPEPFGVTWVVKAREYSVGAVERRRVEQLAIAGAVSPLEMVYRLDRSINGTSLVVVIEVGDVKLLFPGDAQWGTWNAILQNAETRRLVEYATLYKVGHHGSHNATPKDYVENLIGDKPRPTSLVSVARTRYGGGWQNIPLPSLLAELTKRGPVIQSNTDTPRGQAYTEVRFEARIPIDKDHP
jgi:beta-lactamase superfamily II metal-dependent hydrolase